MANNIVKPRSVNILGVIYSIEYVDKPSAVLLVALRIDQLHPGRAIADYEIADILEVDRRTIIKQLRSLSAAGLMLEQRDGKYVVTADGRNTLFGHHESCRSGWRKN